MELQHINVKIFAQEPVPENCADAIAVFHRWIQQRVTSELLIDVADYLHVPEGPGIMLLGHEAHYALDSSHRRLGLLYNRRTTIEGSTQDKLRQAYDAALAACKRLEMEPEFKGKLKFHPGDLEVMVNDRALAPNTTETFAALKPELEQFFDGLFGAGGFDLEHVGEPRERLRVAVRVKSPAPLQA
jgi:hypothetical protein